MILLYLLLFILLFKYDIAIFISGISVKTGTVVFYAISRILDETKKRLNFVCLSHLIRES